MSVAAIQSGLSGTPSMAEVFAAGDVLGLDGRFRSVLDGMTKDLSGQPSVAAVGGDPDEVERRLIEAGQGETVRLAGEAAEQLVASTFIIPLLAAMRESPFQTERFGPTMAERRLGPVFDQQLADRIVQRSDFPLVEAVKNSILSKQAQRLCLTGPATGSVIDAQG